MMGNYEQLKSAIAAVIKTNGNNEITGALLQQVLIGMTSQIGANMTFKGVATPATQPATPDQNCFYMATERGTYSNFDGQELDGTKLAIFFNSSGAWRSWLMPIVDFTFDNTPTEDSTNPVTSDGIFKALMQHDDIIFFADVNGTKYEVEYVWNPRVQDWDELMSDTPLEINAGKIYIDHISFDMFTSPYVGAWIQLNALQASTYSGTVMTEQTAIAPTGTISKTASGVTKTYDLPAESGTLATASQVAAKQDALVSGTNIKTVNNTSLLGSGNVDTNEFYNITLTDYNNLEKKANGGTVSQSTINSICAGIDSAISNGLKLAVRGAEMVQQSGLEGKYINISLFKRFSPLPISQEDYKIELQLEDVSGIKAMELIKTVSGSTETWDVSWGDSNSWASKQDTLVSGTNIKTLNSASLLGSGNLTITTEGVVIVNDLTTGGANAALSAEQGYILGQKVNDVDNVPTAGSEKFVKSGGVQNELALGAVYDVSAKNTTAGTNNDGKFESLSALLSDNNLNTLIPISVRKGGMSIKFVQSSDNKYVQFRYKGTSTTGTPNPFLDTANWQDISGIDSYIGKKLEMSGVGFYISTNKAIGEEVSLTPQSSSNSYRYAIVEVTEGDGIEITGTGGESARLWCILDSQRKVIAISNSYTSAENKLFKMPQNAAYFVFNDNTTTGSIGLIKNGSLIYPTIFEVDELNKEVEQLNNEKIKENWRLAICFSRGQIDINNDSHIISVSDSIKIAYKGTFITVNSGYTYEIPENPMGYTMAALVVNPENAALSLMYYVDIPTTQFPILASCVIRGRNILKIINSSIPYTIDSVSYSDADTQEKIIKIANEVDNNSDNIDILLKDIYEEVKTIGNYQYIKNDTGVGSTISLTPTTAVSPYKYVIVDAVEGDEFIINALAGVLARAWCFIDSSNVILSVADENANLNGYVLTAPANTAKLIINDYGNRISYYNYFGIKQRTNELYKKSLLKKEYGVYFNVNGNVGDTASLERTTLSTYNGTLIQCTEGDIFEIHATAGGERAKAGVFLSSDRVILKICGAQSANGYFKAPKNAAYLVIDNNTLSLNSFKVSGLVIDNELKIETINNKLPFNYDTIKPYIDDNNKVLSNFSLIFNNRDACANIISMRAKYIGIDAPLISFTLGNYYASPSYIAAGNNDYAFKQWRIPPSINNKDIVINVIIPSGTEMYIDDFSTTRESGCKTWNGGVRLDAHLGFQTVAPENTMAAFELAAICNYPACIVNPIVSADGTIYCYHENDIVLSTDNGETFVSLSATEFNALTDVQLQNYRVFGPAAMRGLYNEKIPTLDEFFQLCARTGMRPMFSTHPALNVTQWGEVKEMLIKYNLLHLITIKAFDISTLETAYSILGDEVEGFIYDVSGTDVATYCNDLAASTLADFKGRKGIDFVCNSMTEVIASTVINAGFFPSVWDVYNIPGTKYKQLIDWGVVEFTDDNNGSSGLNW